MGASEYSYRKAVADTAPGDSTQRSGEILASHSSGRLLSQIQDACLLKSVAFDDPLSLFSNGRLVVPLVPGTHSGGIIGAGVTALGLDYCGSREKGVHHCVGCNHQRSRCGIGRRARRLIEVRP